MQTGAKYGMVMLNDILMKFVLDGSVSAAEVLSKAVDKKDLTQKLRVAGIDLSDVPEAVED
jgi:Tfp pilus assembly pilus retraction ATPase PilT